MAVTSNDPRRVFRARIYLVAGVVSLFVMAFFWGADPSFRYIAAGIAIYCFFLAFWTRPHLIGGRVRDHIDEIGGDFRTIFRAKRSQPYRPPGSATRAQAKPAMILIGFLFIVFLFFSMVISVVVFSPDNSLAETEWLVQQAEYFRMNGEYDSAVVYYRRALIDQPDRVDVNNGIGAVFLEQQNYDSATKYIDAVLEGDPGNETALYNKASIQYNQKNYQAVIDIAEQILASNSSNTDAMLLIGDSYYVQDDYDSAIPWYEDAYELGARSAQLLHIMAYIYDTKGKAEDAIRLYRETLQYDSSRVEIYDRLAEMYGGEPGAAFRELAVKYRQEQQDQ